MARTWRDLLRPGRPGDMSPPTAAEAMLMMRSAFLQAAGYPEAVRDQFRDQFPAAEREA